MKLLYSLIAILMMGCSNITFDGLQYDRYVTLVEDATRLKQNCDKPEIKHQIAVLKHHTDHMKLYATLRSNSPEVLVVTTQLSSMVDEMYNKYQSSEPSKVYCTEKLDIISSGAKTVASTLGAQ